MPGTFSEPPSPAGGGALFGRDAAFAALGAAFAPGTLTAVVGPPGVGKTSLVAARTAGLADRVWVDLGGAVTAADLGAMFGRALAQSFARPEDVHDRVVGTFAARTAPAVVLDAAEHLDADAWAALGRLVAALPNTAWLATSVVRPPVARVFELDRLGAEDARALLLARARERALSQAPDPADPVWAALAERLGGLPLALELAAGRFGVLTAAEILERLDRPALLAGGRHGTFTGALRYAWDLLAEGDREALARCCVFRGGFDLAAAEAVLGDEALDRLTALRERSALAWRDGRLYVFDGLRRFAEAEGAALLASSVVAHRDWYARHGDALRAALEGPDWAGALERLRMEQHNLSAAWGSARLDDAPTAARLGLALLASLEAHGPQWRLEDLADTPAVARAAGDSDGARVLARYAMMRYEPLGPATGGALLDEAVAMAEALGEADVLADVLAHRSFGLWMSGELERSRLDLERALALGPRPYTAGVVLNNLSTQVRLRQDWDAASAMLRAAIENFEACGATRMVATLRHNLGFHLAHERRFAEARPLLESAPHPRSAQASENIALAHLAEGRTDLAAPHLHLGHETARAQGSASYQGFLRLLAGLAAWMDGDRAAARGALAEALGLFPAGSLNRAAFARVWAAALEGGEGLPHALAAARADRVNPELLGFLDAVATGAPLPPVARWEGLPIQIARRLFPRIEAVLKVEGDGRWFERPGGRVELSRRGALRRILAALVVERRARPGVGLPVEALFEAGWPGETAQPEAAAGRVYTAVRELRALGLDVALRKHADGYLLDPQVEVAIVA